MKKSEKQPPKEHKRYANLHFVQLLTHCCLDSTNDLIVFAICCNRYNLKKLTYDERKARLIERLNALNEAGDEDDDE